MTEIEREAAVEFDKRVNLALKYLFAAATELKNRIDPEHFQVYARALGHASRELDLGVLEPIYRAHPDLRPDFLGGTRSTLEFEQYDPASCPVSPTLFQLNAFLSAAPSRSSRWSEIAALFRYLGLEVPSERSTIGEDDLRHMLAEELERQNRYLNDLAQSGWDISRRQFQGSVFVDEIVSLNRPSE